MMKETIRRLCGASLGFVLMALSSYYFGPRYALGRAPAAAARADCDLCFGVGDEWKILGGFLLVLAVAFAVAAGLMWLRERKDAAAPVSIIS